MTVSHGMHYYAFVVTDEGWDGLVVRAFSAADALLVAERGDGPHARREVGRLVCLADDRVGCLPAGTRTRIDTQGCALFLLGELGLTR